MQKVACWATAALCCMAAGLGHAEDQTAATGTVAEATLEEVVVSSTRRSSDLQRVAATVLAVPAETLKDMNITSILQLPDVTPGLVITPAGGNNAYVRGIGSASTGFNEAQVAVYVDGLYLPNPAAGIYSFNNIEQVEVLKGPQGTLYGRNATGGLMAIRTRDPGRDRRIDASAGYANYDAYSLNFYGSTPLSSTVAASVAVYQAKQNKGWSINTFTGDDIQKSSETGVQGKVLWQPSSATKVTASVIYDYNDRDVGYGYEVYPGTIAADGTPYLGKYRSSQRIDPHAPFYAWMASLKIEQDLGFASLMSLSGYQTSRQRVTFSPAPGIGQPLAGQGSAVNYFPEHSRTWSQEFQLTSAPSESRFEWLAGAFFFDDLTRLQLDTSTTCIGTTAASCTPGFVPTRSTGYPTTKSYSAYGDATYRFFEATRLTLGLRYTDEKKGLTGQVAPLAGYPDSVATLPATTVFYPGQPYAGNPAGIPTELHFTKWTYRAVLAQDFSENVHAYISDNLGFKSGAFNANAFNNPPVNPEILKAYEAGVKTELLDHRVRFNTSVFYYDYQDVQVRSTAPPALPGNAILLNAAKERQKGVDVDFNIAVAGGFSINGGYEYLDSKYRDFPGAVCSTPGTRVVNGVTVGAPITVSCNQAGFTTPNSPRNSGTVGFIYKVETGAGGWALNASDHFNSSYPITSDGNVVQDAHHIFNASVLWTSMSKQFDIQVWGKNLSNEYRWVTGLAASANNYVVVPDAPRTYGVTVGYHLQ